MKSLELLARDIAMDEFKSARSIVDSACGQTGACDKEKTWVVDVDTKDMNEVETIKSVIAQCEPFNVEKTVALIPTLHGYHIISKPFNKQKFYNLYQNEIDIHENNPTILYFKEKE